MTLENELLKRQVAIELGCGWRELDYIWYDGCPMADLAGCASPE